MDVDGTLTDGRIYIGEIGESCKAFNVKDGYGISNLLISYGIKPVIITGRTSKMLEIRCKELGIVDLFQGVYNKIEILKRLIKNTEYSYNNVAYIGDDLNDLSCMELIKSEKGIVGCPADAVDRVKDISDFISKRNGGDGAVRDFIDWLISFKR